MTKAIGSTAAMILMDRGKLDANTPVEAIIPEFSKVQVLDGFDGETPRLRPPRAKATVRQLATHTSGLVYEFWNPDIPRYMQATGHPSILSGSEGIAVLSARLRPRRAMGLRHRIDWLGQVVEAVDGRKIDRFCREEIFGPLNMPDTRFEVEDDLSGRLAAVSIRGEDGKFGDFAIAPPAHPEFYGMGHALYSTAPDYLRFLRMYLNKGQLDGKRLISQNGVENLLANQIGDTRIGVLKTVVPAITADVDIFPGVKKSAQHGLHAGRRGRPGNALGRLAVLGGRSQHPLLVRSEEESRGGAADPVAAVRRAAFHGRVRAVRARGLRVVVRPGYRAPAVLQTASPARPPEVRAWRLSSS